MELGSKPMTDDISADTPYPRRGIRSYVRREGRLTRSQCEALETLWPRFGIDLVDGNTFDWATFFPLSAPVVLEIGFGDGASLLHQAQTFSQYNYIGIEVHRPGVGRLLNGIAKAQINNLRVICADAVDVLRNHIPDGTLAAIQLFFPDPWHKKRHHKRRMVQTEWVSLVAQKLIQGGRLHLATDWQAYAEHMMLTLSAHPAFTNTQGQEQFAPRPPERIETKFEQRGQRLGHGSWDLIFTRKTYA
jgi:tRNA (guanine-N7-)-methyltransferase